MQNVSSEYLTAVRARTRTDRITGTVALKSGATIQIDEKTLQTGSLQMVKSCITGEELAFGSVILSEVGLTIKTDQPQYVFYDAEVTLEYGVLLADKTWYTLPLGVYTVVEAGRTRDKIKLVAYDHLLKLDAKFDGTAIQGTPFNVLTTICELAGIPLSLTEDEIKAMPNGEQPIQIDEQSGCSTFRECVKVVCQLLAGFALATTDGGLKIRQFGKTPVAELTKSHRYSLETADYICKYVGVSITTSTAVYSSYDTSGGTGLEMEISMPPAWDNGTEETLQGMTDAVMNELKQLPYTPCDLEIPGDPALECGDLLSLPTDNGDVSSLITSYTWTFRSKMQVVSAGQNPYLKNIQPQKTQIIRELEKQTYSNKLIFYSFTNQGVVDISGSEIKELAKVTFVTTEATSAMFLAQLPVTVTVDDEVETTEVEHDVSVTDSTGATAEILDADGNPLTLKVVHSERTVKPGAVDLEIYYYMNGSQVEYELVDHLTAGKHILSLFYPLAELNGNQNNEFSVRLRCASGSVEIAKRALKATVTGQGLAATTAWDGTITIEEVVGRFGGKLKTGLRALSEAVDVHTEVPTPATITEVVGRFGGRLRTGLRGFVEEIKIAPIVEQQTIDPGKASMEWNYNERYVTLDDSGMKLQTGWSYTSAESDIDEGRMTVVKAITNDLASVESVEVIV